MAPSQQYTGVWQIVYDFQTLIAAVISIVVAVFGALALWRATNAPIAAARKSQEESDQRRRIFAGSVLVQNLSILRSLARQAIGVVRVLAAGNHSVGDGDRSQMRLQMHPVMGEWEFVSLFSTPYLARLMELSKLVDDHNYDVDRAGSFSEEHWRRSVLDRLDTIQTEAARLIGPAMIAGRGE